MKISHSITRKTAAIAAVLALTATVIGGTLAWRDYAQHKSNELSGSQIKYEARLVENFTEVPDWKVDDGPITKEIRVTNLGKSSENFGDVYVRIQLKEYMEIGSLTYVETDKRYMIDTEGNFIVFATEAEAQAAWPGHNVAQLTDKVTGVSGWFIETQAHDPNGQMGKYVVTDIVIGAPQPVIPGSVRAVDVNHQGIAGTDAQGNPIMDTKSDECNYPVHAWNNTELETRQYISWQLNDGSIIKLSDWIAQGQPPVAKWIIDDLSGSGWVYWGQAIQTDGGVTEDFLKSVSLIVQPDGSFYYVIHTDMEAVSLDELTSGNVNWGEAGNGIIKNAPSAKFDGTVPTSVEAGKTVASPTVTIGPAGSAQSPLIWTSSDPSIATVDQNGVVTGVKEGGPVTITVTAPNGARAFYPMTVTAGTPVSVPATGVTINGGDKEITVGENYTPGYAVTPSNSTDKPVWSSSDPSVATVDPDTGKITGIAEGTAVITVTAGSQTASITVTIKAAADPFIETSNGSGPYDTGYSDSDQALNFSLLVKMKASDFSNQTILQKGAIQLSKVLPAGTDTTGLGVKAADPAMSQYFSIGTDKNGDPAIIYTYVPDQTTWDTAADMPVVTVNLLLTQPDHQDTPITVTLRYNGSLYTSG